LTRYFIFLFSLFVYQFSVSQELNISGLIKDETGLPVEYANIILFSEDESEIIKGASSDFEGEFILKKINAGNYKIRISFIGYQPYEEIISLSEDLKINVVLEESSETLDEVSITAVRPTLKREADRLVFSVENTALIEGSMLQVLKNTPGVLVLGDDITVKNENPTIFINDRRVYLSSNDLNQLLEGSSANSVKSVEVITNPSARYDAESGVVLNIVMSKNLITGYRGSVLGNYTQGVFPRYGLGTSHFFKKDKISFNLNYNYANDKLNRDGDDTVNYLDNDNTVDQSWRSITNRNTSKETHTLNANFDYEIDDNNTLSLSSNILYLPYFKYEISNNTDITDNNGAFLSRFIADNTSRDDKYNLGFDLNFNHNLEKGSLLFNVHYTTYSYERNQGVVSNFFDENNDFLDISAFRTDANQDTDIISSKIDYSLPINENSNFEAGAKYSAINTDSNLFQFDIDTNTGIENINGENSDAFDYEERIYAAYANYATNSEQWSVNAGLRVEQTNVDGFSPLTDVTISQDYFGWFPNASIQYNISEKYNVYANFKRSITRPSYANLNPFKFFINENYVVSGNPNLTPTFVNHTTVGTGILGGLFVVEAYYKNLEGAIFEIPRQDNNTNIIEYISVNFDKKIEFGFDFITYFNVTQKWSLYAVTSFYNVEEETDFGNGLLSQSQWSNYSILQNDFSFLEDNSLNATLSLTWVGKNLQGFQTVEDRLFSELALSKTILDNNGVVSLSVGDIFNYQDPRTSVRYQNQFSFGQSDIDNRYIKLGFRYKFGNTRLETNQRGINLDERDRLNRSEK